MAGFFWTSISTMIAYVIGPQQCLKLSNLFWRACSDWKDPTISHVEHTRHPRSFATKTMQGPSTTNNIIETHLRNVSAVVPWKIEPKKFRHFRPFPRIIGDGIAEIFPCSNRTGSHWQIHETIRLWIVHIFAYFLSWTYFPFCIPWFFWSIYLFDLIELRSAIRACQQKRITWRHCAENVRLRQFLIASGFAANCQQHMVHQNIGTGLETGKFQSIA